MKNVRLALLVPAAVFAAVIVSPAHMVEAHSPADDVLRQEARWLKAITNGDRATVASILLPKYMHINDQGLLIDRAQELENTVPLPVTFTETEQTVDFAGLAAVVHGVNTITQPGKAPRRDRFTDVFVFEHGTWRALSAQETAL